MILLRTTEQDGTCFLRTDQLDGETDWKLRLVVVVVYYELLLITMLYIELLFLLRSIYQVTCLCYS
jgi:hypothetical protein